MFETGVVEMLALLVFAVGFWAFVAWILFYVIKRAVVAAIKEVRAVDIE